MLQEWAAGSTFEQQATMIVLTCSNLMGGHTPSPPSDLRRQLRIEKRPKEASTSLGIHLGTSQRVPPRRRHGQVRARGGGQARDSPRAQ